MSQVCLKRIRQRLDDALEGVHLCHLKGGNVIGKVFGVSRKTLVGWARAGAPLAVVGKKYQANYYVLLQWLISRGESTEEHQARRERSIGAAPLERKSDISG